MKPAPLDIEIYRGDKFTLFFRVRNKNSDGTAGSYIVLTGQTPTAQIRATEDDTTVLATFTSALGDQTLFPGSVLLTLSTTVTSTLTFVTAKWDVQLADGTGEPRTYLAGNVNLIKDVTHA